MAIYQVTQDEFLALEETSFAKVGLHERSDIQRLLRKQIGVVAEDTYILADEFADWDDSKRRIDLLGLDKDANLVVIELKRTEDGGHMELQAIRYAAMVAAMTFDKAVEVHAEYLQRMGSQQNARDAILEFLEWDEPSEDGFAQDVRIILVSADFGRELTTAVLWLNERGLDIRCVRIKPYGDNGRTLVDVQQVVPLPDAEEYQIRINTKTDRERAARREQSGLGGILKRYWTELLNKARPRTPLHNGISPVPGNWIGTSSGCPGLGFNYVFGKTCPRVDLYIDTGDKDTNKRIFDELHAVRPRIEERFGASLGWERLDTKRACRVRADLSDGTVRDEANWPAMQDAMIDAMIRFEKALRPEIDRLKK